MYELVIVWNDGEKQIYEYETRTEAEEALSGYQMAFGRQVWGCVRRKVEV